MVEISDASVGSRDFDYPKNVQDQNRVIRYAPTDRDFCEAVKRLAILLEGYKDKEYRDTVIKIGDKLRRTHNQPIEKRDLEKQLVGIKLSAEDIWAELMKLQYRKGMTPKESVEYED